VLGHQVSREQVEWMLRVWGRGEEIETVTAPKLVRQVCRRFVALFAELDGYQIRNETSDKLIYSAQSALQHGYKRQARANLIAAIRLHPRRATRALTFQLLWASL
jgi:hypothetical protein